MTNERREIYQIVAELQGQHDPISEESFRLAKEIIGTAIKRETEAFSRGLRKGIELGKQQCKEQPKAEKNGIRCPHGSLYSSYEMMEINCGVYRKDTNATDRKES